jgi:hypothetical protein
MKKATVFQELAIENIDFNNVFDKVLNLYNKFKTPKTKQDSINKAISNFIDQLYRYSMIGSLRECESDSVYDLFDLYVFFSELEQQLYDENNKNTPKNFKFTFSYTVKGVQRKYVNGDPFTFIRMVKEYTENEIENLPPMYGINDQIKNEIEEARKAYSDSILQNPGIDSTPPRYRENIIAEWSNRINSFKKQQRRPKKNEEITLFAMDLSNILSDAGTTKYKTLSSENAEFIYSLFVIMNIVSDERNTAFEGVNYIKALIDNYTKSKT